MEKVILYKDSKLLLLQDSDGNHRLPYINELPHDTPIEEPELFRFPGYVAIPLPDSLQNTISPFRGSGGFHSDHQDSPFRGLGGFFGLRESWTLLPEEDYRAAAKGAELLNWSASLRHCSRCGGKMLRATEISKKCEKCGNEVFPSLWPAIVVLVIKESPDGDPVKEEALLVHARTLSRPGVQTLVAGFVETGESLEECVAREVKEETSLDIEDIRYEGSQSWPFPHQLMLGFTARYRGGEIAFADGEISFGGFFRRDNLPELPTLPSLSRRIIDRWAQFSD